MELLLMVAIRYNTDDCFQQFLALQVLSGNLQPSYYCSLAGVCEIDDSKNNYGTMYLW